MKVLNATALTVTLITIVLGLSGCAAEDPAPTKEPGTTPSESASPAPLLTELPVSCADVDVAPIASSLGADLALGAISSPLIAAFQLQSGSLTCQWSGPDVNAGPRIFLIVGRGVGGPDDGSTTEDGGVDADDSGWRCGPFGCGLDARVGAFGASLSSVTIQVPQQVMVEVMQPVIDRLRGGPEPVSWTRPAGARPAIYDCTALSSADVGGTLGPVMNLADSTMMEEGGGRSETATREDFAGAGRSECLWSDQSTQTFVTALVLSGGGFRFPDALLTSGWSSDSIEVAGADAAWLVCGPDECRVDAVVGDDVIEITPSAEYMPPSIDDDQLLGVARVIVPAFAASS